MFPRMFVIAALALAVLAPPAFANAFFGFIVVNVPEGDVLNVRTGPGTGFPIQTAYTNGTSLSLTGTCTGGFSLRDSEGTQAQTYARIKNRWCEVWHDPKGNGVSVNGWVRGRYIYPN